MADFTTLRSRIAQDIASNGSQQITGEVLQEVLLEMTDTTIENCLGNMDNYQKFAGNDNSYIQCIFKGLYPSRKYRVHLFNPNADVYEASGEFYRFFIYSWKDKKEVTKIYTVLASSQLTSDYTFIMPDDGTSEVEIGFRCRKGQFFPISVTDITDEDKDEEIQKYISVKNYVDNMQLNATGGLVAASGTFTMEDMVAVDPGSSVTWRFYDTTEGQAPVWVKLVEYDENKNVVDSWTAHSVGGVRTFNVSSACHYVRASFCSGEDRYLAYVKNSKAYKFVPSDSGVLETKINEIKTSAYSNYTIFTTTGGTNTTKKKFYNLKGGSSYKINIHNTDARVEEGDYSRLYIEAIKDGSIYGDILYVPSRKAFQSEYPFTMPEGCTEISVAIRGLSGEVIPVSIVEVTSGQGTSILDLNPESEFLPKMMSAKKRYYFDSDPNRPKPVVLAHISDIHMNWENVKRFLQFKNKYSDYIDMCVNTGDTTMDTYSDDISGYDSIEGVSDIVNVIGNHDTCSDYSNWQTHIGVDAYRKFIAPHMQNWIDKYGVVPASSSAATAGYCFFHKDFAENNLRILFVDIMYYNSTENDWMQAKLSEARSIGYHVLIATHFSGSTRSTSEKALEKVECNYTTLYQLASDTSGASLYKYNSAAYMMMDSVSNFISNGGVFIGYIQGHIHAEVFGKIARYPNQLMYAVGSSIAREVPDYYHTQGTRFQDEFNVVSIDTQHSVIKIYKVGANIDLFGREKNCTCINYQTGSIVSEN